MSAKWMNVRVLMVFLKGHAARELVVAARWGSEARREEDWDQTSRGSAETGPGQTLSPQHTDPGAAQTQQRPRLHQNRSVMTHSSLKEAFLRFNPVCFVSGNSWKRGFHSLGLRASNHDAGRPAAYYKRTLLPIIPLMGKEADDHR